MTKPTVAEIQLDHKHWLRDLERWQYHAGAWAAEQETVARDLRQFEERVKRYNADLEHHAASLETHRREILDAERAMMESPASPPDAALLEKHRRRAEHHASQLKQHERLMQIYHLVMAQLTLLGKPISDND